MRKLSILLALAIGLMAYAGAKIEWSSLTHDFGAFNESKGPAMAEFTYYNRGDEPLIIMGARANCGCTTPKYTKEALLPGDSGIMTVAYDPAGRPGRFDKRIYVDSNSDEKRSTLTIKGVVIGSGATLAQRYPLEVGPMRMAHPAALLGTINKGHVKSAFETGYNASTDTLRPVVTDVPKWMDVNVLPKVVAPGEQVSFNFYIHSEKIPDWDMVTDYVTIRPDVNSPMKISYPVVITLSEDFSKLTDKEREEAPVVKMEKRLDPVKATKDGAVARFSIANEGKTPLRIRRIYTQMADVKIDVKSNDAVKPGKSREVSVTIPASALGESAAKSIVMTVITNDPVTPKTSVTIPVENASLSK